VDHGAPGKIDCGNLGLRIGRALWLEQLKAIGITIALAVIATTIIGLLVKVFVGLRIAPDIERQGLDINEHGEEGYYIAS